MKLPGSKIQVEYTPLSIGGSLNVIGGGVVQFFDGKTYTPNREGTVASPILLRHEVTAVDQDTNQNADVIKTTTFYENGVVISAATAGYSITGNELKVAKNIAAGSTTEIKAVTKIVDKRDNKVYERIDFVNLRTILKTESEYQLIITPHGRVLFDAYRNPNTTIAVVATLKKGADEVTDLTGITFKWLNAAGLNAFDEEAYASAVSTDGKTLTVDKTYIDSEVINCEAWKDGKMIANDSVTFVRKFNSFNTDIRIPELPLSIGVDTLNCQLLMTDLKGNIDVDAAFLVKWMVSEGGVDRETGYNGASVKIPVSAINMKASKVQIYPAIYRREAYAAVVTDLGEVLVDDTGNVLTVETFGN